MSHTRWGALPLESKRGKERWRERGKMSEGKQRDRERVAG